MNKVFFATCLLFFWSNLITGQAEMEVIRTKAVDRYTPVTNIFIDAEGNKWVGNRKGLFQVHSPEQATLVTLAPTDWSLGQTPSGNANLAIPLESLLTQMGNDGEAIRSKDDRITAAVFDEKKGELWVGTRESGLFLFKTQPTLKLSQRYGEGAKLPSDQINALFLDTNGRLWIGTGDGCVFGKDGKWKTDAKLFSIKAFAQNATDIWVMGDDLLWKVDARENWEPIDIDPSLTENEVVGIAFDGNGHLWVASEIIARFDPATEAAKVFGPAEEFTSQDVSCIAADRDNAIWIGTNDKGLYLIQKADAMAVTCLIDKPLSCGLGKKDASLKVTVAGGEAPYTYSWSGGLTGTNPQNLGPGEYSLTITDSRGKSKPAKFTIPDPNLALTAAQDKPAGEDGAANGAASVKVQGGNPAYSYAWDNGETTATASKLAEGQHFVTVTDKNGCTATASVSVSRKVGALVVNISQTKPITCAGEKTASLKAEVSGGKTPYQYQWANAGLMNGETATNLAPGNYSVTVTDATGQASSASFEVKAPNAVEATAKVDKPASTGNKDGAATVTASGGMGSFTFRWDNGETAAKAVKLAPGLRTVTVVDASGCTASATVTITENILPLAISIIQAEPIKCAGEKTVGLRTEVSGGKAPYQYKWSAGGQSSSSATGLTAGTHSVTVTDATGATASGEIVVKEPKPIVATITADAPASTGNADGKATARATGGTGSFSFKWDNGEAAAKAVKLAPGQHTVTATDEAGCTATATVGITENILPLAISILQTKEIKCAGEKSAVLKAEVSGGKGPFQFSWDGGLSGETPASLAAGSYAVTVTDAAGGTATANFTVKEPKPASATATADAPASTGNADGKATARATGGTGSFSFKWDNGEAVAKAVKLAPGQHTVTATDEAGCTATATVGITENILPLAISILQTKEIKCAGEKSAALKAEVSGGKGPFQFSWDGGLSGETPASLAAGSYAVTVTDAAGGTATANFTVKEPKPASATATADAPASTGNADGKATARATGGTGSFSFKWDNGEAAAKAVKLAPGQHTVTATDEAGCTATATVGITENILPLEVSIEQLEEPKCAGDKTSLNVVVSGGKEPYGIAWDNGAKSKTASGLTAGNYAVTITDALGTTATATKKTVEPQRLTLNVVKIRPSTTDKTKNGKASLEASGGTGSYQYAWDNGETTLNATALPAGLHQATVTDANGCQATASFEVKTRIIPELSAENLRSGETIKLEKIYFQPDSTNMDPTSLPTLDELYDFLSENTGVVIEVGGHTNGIPSHEFCDKLSTERAKSVAQYLVSKGLPTARITYKGYGKRNPVATNATPEGRAKNQRVEVKFVRME